MLTLRQRIFAISGIVVGLVLAFILVSFIRNRPDKVETPDTASVESPRVESSRARATERPPVEPVVYPPGEQVIRQTARMFVERFASFSNQNDNAHIEDAMALATPRMQRWLETQQVELSREYSGMTTQVLAMEISNESEVAARVEVSTQQSVSKLENGLVSSKMQQRKGRVELTKVGNDWEVDGFFWEE